MAEIQIKNVEKWFGSYQALKSIDLTISDQEFMVLLGASGCGKTTLLRIIAGLETASQGEVWINDRRIDQLAPKDRGIAMVFQNYALFPHMTVNENLAFPLEVRGQSKSERETNVKKALDMVQMSAFGNRRPAQLSGGQQQRIALARSLVFEPDLVLMDEPLGALDKQLREHMQFEIKHLHDRLGVTVVYVTHDQSEALTMSDRIAVFDDGIIQQLAPPSDLYERPENAFVAQFIGENNRIEATVSELNGDTAIVDYGNGSKGQALAINCGGVGTKTVLSIRPERVQLGQNHGSNAIDAEVKELIYLGDHIRCRMNVMGNEDFVVKVANSAGHTHLNVGEKTTVSWDVSDCRALDA